MNEEEIEIKIHDMSSTLHPVDAYALVMEEVNGNRKLPIIIGALEAQAIKIVMKGYRFPRPLTHDLFISLTNQLGAVLKKIVIYKVKDGVFYSYLFYDKDGEEIKIDSRTSDAVALALRYHCPMYTTAQIMASEHLHEENEHSFSVTLNGIGVPLLKEALAKAIEAENYEQASYLRDEIKRRMEENPDEEANNDDPEENKPKTK